MPEYIAKALAEMQEISDSRVISIPAVSGAPGANINTKHILNATLEKARIPSYLQIVDEIRKTASNVYPL